MKVTVITLLSFLTLSIFFGCMTYQQASVEDIEIVEAGFEHWTQSTAVQSDVRERGTDLQLVVKKWPVGAIPNYIIFRKMRSFPVEVEDSTEAGVQMKARIVRQSAVLSETSERVEKSDRLIYTLQDGKERFIEIEEWSRIED